MGKFELTISKDYVPDWGVKEAVRELFQNALDQETVTPDNAMFFAYDEEAGVLEIGNKHSVLEPSSLLLGQTSKLNDELTIGQFGEGYKLAMLILLRNDLKVTFYNYGKKEVWKPRFVNSRRYKQEVLTVFTEKKFWEREPDNSLIIKIEGITAEMYDEVTESNLHLSGINAYRESASYGKLLEDDELRGKIFVNGLYVTEDTSLEYGYDFLPKVLKLKRDRSMVSSFDLKTTITKLWKTLDGDNTSEMAKMIVNNTSDLNYVHYDYRVKQEVSESVFDTFKEQHGENAIAITDDVPIDIFMEEHPECKPVVVPSGMHDIITNDPRYDEEIEEYFVEIDRTPKEKLSVWFEKLKENNYIGSDLEEEFEEIMKDL